jgi:hypothetical protein
MGNQKTASTTRAGIKYEPSQKAFFREPFTKQHCRQSFEVLIKRRKKRGKPQFIKTAEDFPPTCEYLAERMGLFTADSYEEEGLTETQIVAIERQRKYAEDRYKDHLTKKVKRLTEAGRSRDEIAEAVTTFTVRFIERFQSWLRAHTVRKRASRIQ